jgi:hypothetical protein
MSTAAKDTVPTARITTSPVDIPPGTHVVFRRGADGRLQVSHEPGERTASALEQFVGSAGPGLSTDEFMALMRGDD